MTGIYYSDLFIINGSGCLVMGFGKSRTCRNYTGENTVEICTDSIRLEKHNNELFGYADLTIGLLPFEKGKAQNTKIKYLIRMLDEKETDEMKCTAITEIDKNQYSLLCDFNITFGIRNAQERREEFKNLINNVELICILVPWCIDMESKGKMIRDYIK